AAVEPKPTPAPAAPEKPAAASTSGTSGTSGNAEILATVNGWAKAWSGKNVDGYLAYYAKDFKTPGGEARADWEKARRARISAPKSISVTIEAPKVSVAADGHVSVTFRQGYRSDVIKGTSTTKTLVLAKAEGRWLIQ